MHKPHAESIDVLVISNNEVEQVLVEAYLQQEATVRVAATYEQAEQACRDKFPEVTICEAELRGVDIRKICNELIRKPCVFISSRDRDIERRKGLLQVKGCYLTRPYNREQLLDAVHTAKNETATIDYSI